MGRVALIIPARVGVEIEYEIHYNCGPQKALRGSRGKKTRVLSEAWREKLGSLAE